MKENIPPLDIPLEKKIFWQYAREYIDEMRLLFREGKLSPKYGDWNNVIDHSLVQLAEMSELSDLLGLTDEQKNTLERAALVHDWKKRLEIKPADFTYEQKEKALSLFEKIKPDETVLEATEVGFSKEILDDRATFLQRIMFYIDNITRGKEIVLARERIDEVESRRQDLNNNEELTRKLGGRYWDIERDAMKKVEQEISSLLKERGFIIDSAEDVPVFLKEHVLVNFDKID
jgi:hypothetical protein